MAKRRVRVALICGGSSAEREVSLAGAAEIERALDPDRFRVVRFDPARDLEGLIKAAREIDVAFVLLHGPYGEDGTIQGLLELLGVPYQGSGVLGSAMAMNKNMAKTQYRQTGIPTPDWLLIKKEQLPEPGAVVERLGLPLMVKPCVQGSSVGMALVREEGELVPAVEEALRFDQRVIVEQFIQGRELTGGVLGLDPPQALPLVEIVPGQGHDFFDYEAKYTPGVTREICPAPLDGETTRRAQEMALKAHGALRLTAYSRTDMLLDQQGGLWAIETNTIPGMTPTSLFPQAAAAAGIPFPRLIEMLLEMAVEVHKRGGGRC